VVSSTAVCHPGRRGRRRAHDPSTAVSPALDQPCSIPAIVIVTRMESGRNTLSVCCVTDDATAQTATMLALFRPLAAEIVVAVDSRVPESVLDPLYGGVADRLLRYEYAEPVERPFAWLHAQCSGDWILRIDSDEVPSAELLHALPDLLAVRDVHQYPLPRRWLFEDAGHALNETPWWPDYQFRLVRNDPATLWFSGTMHSSAHHVRPARFLRMPILHTDCIINSYEKRSAKMAKYAAGLQSGSQGAILNSIFYLPEEHRSEPLALVPQRDVELIERVLEGRRHVEGPGERPEPGKQFGTIHSATREEIDAYWEERPVAEAAKKATIELMERDRHMRVDERRIFFFLVRNDGGETWPYGPLRHPAITLCYRWLTPDGEVVVPEGLHSPLSANLYPGVTDVEPATVDAPGSEGHFVLEVALMLNRTEWFGVAARETFQIVPNRSE